MPSSEIPQTGLTTQGHRQHCPSLGFAASGWEELAQTPWQPHGDTPLLPGVGEEEEEQLAWVTSGGHSRGGGRRRKVGGEEGHVLHLKPVSKLPTHLAQTSHLGELPLLVLPPQALCGDVIVTNKLSLICTEHA